MSIKGRKQQKEGYAGDDAVTAIGSSIRSWLPAVIGLVVVVGAGLWFAGIVPTGSGDDGSIAPAARAASSSSSSSQSMPSFISSAPAQVQEAYAFVAAHTGETQYIPCYCGCGEHSGHRWVRDCFVRDVTSTGITYDDHGSGCDICVNIALEVKSGLAKGQPLSAIRKTVDSKYSGAGGGTDTPLPPS
ncbi:MAG: hypothetical protein EPO22_12585 [Dehalococcoidia bacterium]|nr:MAG: hypothetical protein EPO22_12585 [Dehalococcoidia bacterium]